MTRHTARFASFFFRKYMMWSCVPITKWERMKKAYQNITFAKKSLHFFFGTTALMRSMNDIKVWEQIHYFQLWQEATFSKEKLQNNGSL